MRPKVDLVIQPDQQARVKRSRATRDGCGVPLLVYGVPGAEQRGEDEKAANPLPPTKWRLNDSLSRFWEFGWIWGASGLPCLRLDAADERCVKCQRSRMEDMMVCSSSQESQAMSHGFLERKRYEREYSAGTVARMVIRYYFA